MKQKIKNIFSVSSKKALGKLGLFLIFGMMVLNLNLYTKVEHKYEVLSLNITEAMSKEEVQKLKNEAIDKAAQAMGITFDEKGNIVDLGIGSPTGVGKAAVEGGTSLLLWGILNVLSELAKYSGLLLDLSLRQDFFRAFVDNDGVYDGWVVVRDLLNMFFMLLLLFSAFATIFQVEKYHLRKIIIMLVVMALLVNFSFPICRFIIDFSNSAMYFLLESSFGENVSYSGNVNNFTELGKTIGSASSMKNGLVGLILNIILTFIVAVTFFAIAINLVIRILAFVMLLIMAPAGFAFAFFPDTKNMANDWWSTLFKYAFMGPSLVFFLYLSMSIFSGSSSMVQDNQFFAKDFIRFTVPIAFLWMGLIVSSKLGGYGSAMAMSISKKTGNNIKTYGQKAAWGATKAGGRWADDKTGNFATGTFGAAKMKLAQWNDDHKKASNTRATEFADRIGVDGANQKLVQENLKKWKDANGIEDSEEKRIDSEGTKAEKMALALHRAETKGFDKDPIKAAAQYQEALNVLKDNKVYKELFSGNIRKKNIDLEINASVSDEMKKLGRSLLPSETEAIARKSFDKLDPGDWKEQNIERTIALNKMYGNDGVKDAAKRRISSYKSPNKATENMRGVKYDAGVADGWW